MTVWLHSQEIPGNLSCLLSFVLLFPWETVAVVTVDCVTCFRILGFRPDFHFAHTSSPGCMNTPLGDRAHVPTSGCWLFGFGHLVLSVPLVLVLSSTLPLSAPRFSKERPECLFDFPRSGGRRTGRAGWPARAHVPASGTGACT